MKYTPINMKRSDKAIFKDKSTTNLLANAAKMKIGKAMANSKLQINNKSSNLSEESFTMGDVVINKNLTSTFVGSKSKFNGEQNLPQSMEWEEQQLGTTNGQKPQQFQHQQQQQQHTEHIHTVDEQTIKYAQPLVQQHMQAQIKSVKEMTRELQTANNNESMLIKLEKSISPTPIKSTTSTSTSSTSSSSSSAPFLIREKVELPVIKNEAYAHAVESAPSSTQTITSAKNSFSSSLSGSSTTILHSCSTVLNEQSKQTVLRTVPTTQVVVENPSNARSTATTTTTTKTLSTSSNVEVNSVIDLPSENNLCRDVVDKTRNRQQLQQYDKDTQLIDKCHNIVTTTTNTAATISSNNSVVSVISNIYNNKTNVSLNSNLLKDIKNNNNNENVLNNFVNVKNEISSVITSDQKPQQQQLSETLAPLLVDNKNIVKIQQQQQQDQRVKINYQHSEQNNNNNKNNNNNNKNNNNDNLQKQQQSEQFSSANYRHQEHSVIIANYNHQRQQQQTVITPTNVYDQLNRDQKESKELQQLINNNKNASNRGDPNLNQTSIEQEQQHPYLLNSHNSGVYDLSLQHQLQQQQQLHQSSYANFALHPLSQALNIFSENNNNNNNNITNNNNDHRNTTHNNNYNNNNNNSNNMAGNLTIYANYPYDQHHHGHYLQPSLAHATSHASITHTPNSIDEVIEDTIRDECLEDHHGEGGMSYCTLTSVPDLAGLKETYYQQLTAHEQHLMQQQQQQQQHLHHHNHQHHQQQQQHQHQRHQQPLLQQHLQALSQQHNQHHHQSHASSGGDTPPPSTVLVNNSMGVDMGPNSEMVALQNYTPLTNASSAHRDPYGSMTPDHTNSVYFNQALSPGLQNRLVLFSNKSNFLLS